MPPETVSQEPTQPTRTASRAAREILRLTQVSAPLMYVTTYEEDRFLQDLTLAAEASVNIPTAIFYWSQAKGLRAASRNLIGYSPLEDSSSPQALFNFIETGNFSNLRLPTLDANSQASPRTPHPVHHIIFILRDFHQLLYFPHTRALRDLRAAILQAHYSTEEYLPSSDPSSPSLAAPPLTKSIIITAPILAYGPQGLTSGLEPTLARETKVVEYKLPDQEELQTHLREFLSPIINPASNEGGETAPNISKNTLYNAARALQGLTLSEAEDTASLAASQTGLDVDILRREKTKLLRKTELLEYVEDPTPLSDIGGLDLLKECVRKYVGCFSPEAQAYGVEPLKGIILAGIPGCGKSTAVKAAAKEWGNPLLRLDIGRVMGGVLGSSEANIRQALATVEAISPSTLWIDEVEKAISGTHSSGFTDGGTMSRVFGTLLTAMQEGLEGVTLLVTANDISAIPPEFIRRFDELFFVDLPSPEEREEILSIWLRKKGRTPGDYDLPALSAQCENFTGDELRKVVKFGILDAFGSHSERVTQAHLAAAATSINPLYRIMPREIQALRQWARNRAKYASSFSQRMNRPMQQEVRTSSGQALKLDEALGNILDHARQTQGPTVPTRGNRMGRKIRQDDDNSGNKTS